MLCGFYTFGAFKQREYISHNIITFKFQEQTRIDEIKKIKGLLSAVLEESEYINCSVAPKKQQF